jgi:hypothetical protein
MTRFKRLTDAEARSLTRRELLDRIEAEQAYWFRGHRDRKDPEGFREFTRIMCAYLSPASIAEAMQATIDYIEGRGPGNYWDTRPEPVPPMVMGRPGLALPPDSACPPGATPL